VPNLASASSEGLLNLGILLPATSGSTLLRCSFALRLRPPFLLEEDDENADFQSLLLFEPELGSMRPFIGEDYTKEMLLDRVTKRVHLPLCSGSSATASLSHWCRRR
jgi:hypothetical protein